MKNPGKLWTFLVIVLAAACGPFSAGTERALLPASTPSPSTLATTTATFPPPILAGDQGQITFSRSVRLSNDPSPSGTGSHIFVMNGDGSNPVDLTPNHQSRVRVPTYSPDGKLIAFLSEAGDACNRVFVMGADGSDLTPVSETCYMFTRGPLIWAHDGQRLAIHYPGDFKYHIHSLHGQSVEKVDALSRDIWDLPNYSPDGRHRVDYCNNQIDTTSIYDTCLFSETGAQETKLTVIKTEQPMFSTLPDGSRIAIPLEGMFSWSPDGSRIAFSSEGYIYTINADGTGLTRLTNGYSQAHP